MGTLYTTVGLSVAALVLLAPRVRGTEIIWLACCTAGPLLLCLEGRVAPLGNAEVSEEMPCSPTLPNCLLQISDVRSQRVASYVILGIATLAFRLVTSNHHWKTGMNTSWYF